MSYPIKCLTNIAKYDPNYLIIDNPQTTADILNRDLDKIHTWSTNWLVSFNPQKTETMTISRKINKPPDGSLVYPTLFLSIDYLMRLTESPQLRF
jgi:hypothetical protein